MAFMRLNKCFQLNAKDKINCNTYMLKNSLCFVLSSCILCTLKKKKQNKQTNKKKNFYLFIYCRLCWVFQLHRLFPSCSECGLVFIAVCRLLIAWALLLQSMGSRHVGSMVETPGSRPQAL